MSPKERKPRRSFRSTKRANGPALRYYRELRDLTLEELEELSGVSYTTISRIETGATPGPHKDTLERLANALDITHEMLVIRTPPPGVPHASGNGRQRDS